MDYFTVVLILLIYYIRPQDWVPGLIGVGIVSPVMIVAIVTMIMRAKNEGRKLQFFRSPLDFGMAAFFALIVVTHPDPSGAFKGALPLFAFYFVTVQALDSVERLRKYLMFWLIAVTVLALFGLLSKFGIDPTGAHAMTVANKGRLALGTWMHNNPNALGHTVIIVVPLAYFLFFWKQSISRKGVAIALWLLALEVVQLTESKGAVVSGFGVLVLAYILGKSKLVQILVLMVAFAGGGAVMSLMPRMSEMSNLRSDEGVQGRLLAWEQARTASRNSFTGQGWKTFKANIRWQKMTLPKATHSGYVQVGAELGPVGLTVYVGLFWLGLRSLLRTGRLEDDEERCRRVLFALLVGFALSNWMIDRAYHMELFLFMAGISAFHRLQMSKMSSVPATEHVQVSAGVPASPSMLWRPQPVLAFSGSPSLGWMVPPTAGSGSDRMASDHGVSTAQTSPSRPSLLDVALACAGAYAVFGIWDYILKNL